MEESQTIFDGEEIVATLTQLGVTHVIWVPDSTTGRWETALANCQSIHLVRVCREGEAWPLAAGLLLGGQQPVVVMQSTGFFESGDALRNVAFDLRLPVFAIIGARNWLIPESSDSARGFTLPILQAWDIPFDVIAEVADKPLLSTRYEWARREQRPGIVVLAEGRG